MSSTASSRAIRDQIAGAESTIGLSSGRKEKGNKNVNFCGSMALPSTETMRNTVSHYDEHSSVCSSSCLVNRIGTGKTAPPPSFLRENELLVAFFYQLVISAVRNVEIFDTIPISTPIPETAMKDFLVNSEKRSEFFSLFFTERRRLRGSGGRDARLDPRVPERSTASRIRYLAPWPLVPVESPSNDNIMDDFATDSCFSGRGAACRVRCSPHACRTVDGSTLSGAEESQNEDLFRRQLLLACFVPQFVVKAVAVENGMAYPHVADALRTCRSGGRSEFHNRPVRAIDPNSLAATDSTHISALDENGEEEILDTNFDEFHQGASGAKNSRELVHNLESYISSSHAAGFPVAVLISVRNRGTVSQINNCSALIDLPVEETYYDLPSLASAVLESRLQPGLLARYHPPLREFSFNIAGDVGKPFGNRNNGKNALAPPKCVAYHNHIRIRFTPHLVTIEERVCRLNLFDMSLPLLRRVDTTGADAQIPRRSSILHTVGKRAFGAGSKHRRLPGATESGDIIVHSDESVGDELTALQQGAVEFCDTIFSSFIERNRTVILTATYHCLHVGAGRLVLLWCGSLHVRRVDAILRGPSTNMKEKVLRLLTDIGLIKMFEKKPLEDSQCPPSFCFFSRDSDPLNSEEEIEDELLKDDNIYSSPCAREAPRAEEAQLTGVSHTISKPVAISSPVSWRDPSRNSCSSSAVPVSSVHFVPLANSALSRLPLRTTNETCSPSPSVSSHKQCRIPDTETLRSTEHSSEVLHERDADYIDTLPLSSAVYYANAIDSCDSHIVNVPCAAPCIQTPVERNLTIKKLDSSLHAQSGAEGDTTRQSYPYYLKLAKKYFEMLIEVELKRQQRIISEKAVKAVRLRDKADTISSSSKVTREDERYLEALRRRVLECERRSTRLNSGTTYECPAPLAQSAPLLSSRKARTKRPPWVDVTQRERPATASARLPPRGLKQDGKGERVSSSIGLQSKDIASRAIFSSPSDYVVSKRPYSAGGGIAAMCGNSFAYSLPRTKLNKRNDLRPSSAGGNFTDSTKNIVADTPAPSSAFSTYSKSFSGDADLLLSSKPVRNFQECLKHARNGYLRCSQRGRNPDSSFSEVGCTACLPRNCIAPCDKKSLLRPTPRNIFMRDYNSSVARAVPAFGELRSNSPSNRSTDAPESPSAPPPCKFSHYEKSQHDKGPNDTDALYGDSFYLSTTSARSSSSEEVEEVVGMESSRVTSDAEEELPRAYLEHRCAEAQTDGDLLQGLAVSTENNTLALAALVSSQSRLLAMLEHPFNEQDTKDMSTSADIPQNQGSIEKPNSSLPISPKMGSPLPSTSNVPVVRASSPVFVTPGIRPTDVSTSPPPPVVVDQFDVVMRAADAKQIFDLFLQQEALVTLISQQREELRAVASAVDDSSGQNCGGRILDAKRVSFCLEMNDSLNEQKFSSSTRQTLKRSEIPTSLEDTCILPEKSVSQSGGNPTAPLSSRRASQSPSLESKFNSAVNHGLPSRSITNDTSQAEQEGKTKQRCEGESEIASAGESFVASTSDLSELIQRQNVLKTMLSSIRENVNTTA